MLTIDSLNCSFIVFSLFFFFLFFFFPFLLFQAVGDMSGYLNVLGSMGTARPSASFGPNYLDLQ